MNHDNIRSTWDEGMVQALVSYQGAGMPLPAIAKELGVTTKAVIGKLWKIRHPQPARPRVNAWTERQKEIVQRGALFDIDIDEVCEMLAKAGRPMSPAAIKDSRPYRAGLEQARAVEERMSHLEADRVRLADNRAARAARAAAASSAAPSRSYPWKHPEGAIINLPVVKGYTPEAAHG